MTGMLQKRTDPTALFRDDSPIATLLRVSGKGLERSSLPKHAAEQTITIEITPKEGHAYLHLITLGAGEYYGPNNWADYYNERSHDVTFPEPCGDPTYRLKEGLSKYHSTYMQHGGVYREHENGLKRVDPTGSIVWEGYNEPMHRGEVIVDLPVNQWSDVLSSAERGDPVKWSIGALCPYDVCAICGFKYNNQSPSRCEHLDSRRKFLQIYKGGHLAFAYADQPLMHDISQVKRPADRIAFLLKKVAEDPATEALRDISWEHDSGLWVPGLTRQDHQRLVSKKLVLLKRAAEEEERRDKFPEQGDADVSQAFSSDPEAEETAIKALTAVPLSAILSALAKEKCLMPPTTFLRAVPRVSASVPKRALQHSLRNVFRELMNHPFPEEVLGDTSYDTADTPSGDAVLTAKRLSPMLSTESEPVRLRIIRITMRPMSSPAQITIGLAKDASDVYGDETVVPNLTDYLAREYARYQISTMVACPGDRMIRAAVAANFAK